MLLLLSNNINIQSPWMLSLEIFGSVRAAAANHWQIRYRPSIWAGASKDFINEYNNTSQFFTSSQKISCSEKSFHIFHFLYIFKTNGTELIDESANICLHFSGHVTSQAFDRALSFCCNSCCMYFLWSIYFASLPPLVREGGGLVCESVGKADLLSDHLAASSPGRLLIYHSLVIHLLVLPYLRLG